MLARRYHASAVSNHSFVNELSMTTSVELQIITVLRVIFEVAGWFLLAQGALYVLAGATREKNIIFQLCRIITRPVIQMTRFITPRVVVDKHIPFVAFFLVFWIWILLAYVRQSLCQIGATCG